MMDLRLIVRCIFILFLYRCFVVYYVFSLYFRSGAVICVWLSDSPIISIGLIRDYVFRFAGLYAIMLCCMHSTPSGVKMCSNKDTMYCPSTVSELNVCVVAVLYRISTCISIAIRTRTTPFWIGLVLSCTTLLRARLCIVTILYYRSKDSTFVSLISCTT
jgi:hypothetical protein